MYLLKKGNFEFKNILTKGYTPELETPKILKEKVMGDGSVRVVYAQYTTSSISVKFGRLDGITLKEYLDNLTDGEYEYWDYNTRTYKSANFIVKKPKQSMISSTNNETYEEFTITLEKSSEV